MRILDVRMMMTRTVTRAATFLFTYQRRHRQLRYGGREFSEPKLMTEAMLPSQPGIYAIQVRHWWNGLEPIHFGASRNLREEVMGDGRVGFMEWLMDPRSKYGLYVSFNTAPDLDHDSRHREGTRLNRHYFPRRTHSVDEHLANHQIHRLPRSPHPSESTVQ
jgi:hypothetical protein